MVIPNIFSIGSENHSRDIKIYKSFEPYLQGILGISQEEFLSDRNLRRTYQQKFTAIKAKFQSEARGKTVISDDECHNKISASAQGWEEFIKTAIDNTSDNGRSFIASTPLDRYILMSSEERNNLENQLNEAALSRLRAIFQKDNMHNSQELETMLNDKSDDVSDERTHKI